MPAIELMLWAIMVICGWLLISVDIARIIAHKHPAVPGKNYPSYDDFYAPPNPKHWRVRENGIGIEWSKAVKRAYPTDRRVDDYYHYCPYCGRSSPANHLTCIGCGASQEPDDERKD